MNIKSIEDRIRESAKSKLEARINAAFREVDELFGGLPSCNDTIVMSEQTVRYWQARNAIADAYVAALLPTNTDRDIKAFMQKVLES